MRMYWLETNVRLVASASFGLLAFTFAATGDNSLDLERMQGDWVLAAYTEDGEPKPGYCDLVSIQGSYISFIRKGPGRIRTSWGMNIHKLDSNTSPKAVDLAECDGSIRPGIYDVREAKLTFCFTVIGQEMRRPTEFASAKKSGQILVELKRAKE
jgi:uncharacterized protein (TIGR03067 family)